MWCNWIITSNSRPPILVAIGMQSSRSPCRSNYKAEETQCLSSDCKSKCMQFNSITFKFTLIFLFVCKKNCTITQHSKFSHFLMYTKQVDYDKIMQVSLKAQTCTKKWSLNLSLKLWLDAKFCNQILKQHIRIGLRKLALVYVTTLCLPMLLLLQKFLLLWAEACQTIFCKKCPILFHDIILWSTATHEALS